MHSCYRTLVVVLGYIPSDYLGEDELLEMQTMTQEAGVSLTQDWHSADVLLVFSDNDLLQLVSEIDRVPPVLVVETRGDFAFFAQVSIDDFSQLINQLQQNEFDIEKRLMMEVSFGDQVFLALNDIFMSSSYPNTRIRYDFQVDRRSVFDDLDSANGLLISTPTGSTAMALNLGGTLIHHPASVFQFIAVASRNIHSRNQIVSSESEIVIEVLDAQFPLFLQVDSKRLESKSRIFSIRSSSSRFPLVVLDPSTASNSLQTKLTNKLSFEDTKDLTSSAKFVLHVLQQHGMGMTVNQIMEVTHIQNQKTLRNSLNLLLSKGLVMRRENLEDLREHIYSYARL